MGHSQQAAQAQQEHMYAESRGNNNNYARADGQVRNCARFLLVAPREAVSCVTSPPR